MELPITYRDDDFLVNTTHPELVYSVHQCARFCNDPKHCHDQAVKDIIRCLINTRINLEDKQNIMV